MLEYKGGSSPPCSAKFKGYKDCNEVYYEKYKSDISIFRNEYVDGCKYYLDDNSISKVLKRKLKNILKMLLIVRT